jgi:hypothetical protein
VAYLEEGATRGSMENDSDDEDDPDSELASSLSEPSSSDDDDEGAPYEQLRRALDARFVDLNSVQ